MKSISLTQGKYALVDDEDYDWLSIVKWTALKQPRKNSVKFYAIRRPGGKTFPAVWMHREVLRKHGLLTPNQVDHKDGDGLNNIKSNLRPASNLQNCANRSKSVGTSRFKGVSFKTDHNLWRASIKKNRKVIHLGYFKSETLAAQAYNQSAVVLFGEFARLNEI